MTISPAASLIDAADRGDLTQVKREIGWGELVNDTDDAGRTALHIAAMRGHAEIIRYLASVRGDIHARDNEGKSPLMHAAEHAHPEAVETLLELGAMPSVRQKTSETALHLAVLCKSKFADPVPVIELLAKHKYILDYRDALGHTALMMAAGLNRGKVVDALLELGANPFLTDDNGLSAQDWATNGGATEIHDKLADMAAKKFAGATSRRMKVMKPLKLKI